MNTNKFHQRNADVCFDFKIIMIYFFNSRFNTIVALWKQNFVINLFSMY